MQVRGHVGSKHPPHRAIDSWNKTRRRSGKTPGERRCTRKPARCLGHSRTYEAMKAHVAQPQATPATAEVVHDVGTRKPKRQDDSCTRCGLNHGDTGKCPAHGHKCGKCGRPNHRARFCKTKRVVAAEHSIASEADQRPALVRVAIEGHASTRLQTTLRHSYFRLSVWTASMKTKRSACKPSSRWAWASLKTNVPLLSKRKWTREPRPTFCRWGYSSKWIYQRTPWNRALQCWCRTRAHRFCNTVFAAYPARSKARQKSLTFLSLKHRDLRLSDFRHWRNSESSPSIAKSPKNCRASRTPPTWSGNTRSVYGHREVQRTVPHHRRPRSTTSRTPTTASPV